MSRRAGSERTPVSPGAGLPERAELRLRLTATGPARAVEMLAEGLATVGEELVSWRMPAAAEPFPGSFEEFLETLRSESPANHTVRDPAFDTAGGWRVNLDRAAGSADTWWGAVSFPIGGDGEALAAAVEGSAALCRALAEASSAGAALAGAVLVWMDGDALCLPEVPLALDRSHLVFVSRERIDEQYAAARAFLAAGWSLEDEIGEHFLLVRAPRVESSADFLAQVQEGQWGLARSARSGRTGYYAPRITAEEREVFYAGEARLEMVGYVPAEKLLEMSCYVEGDAHIRGWEIYQLRSIVERGALATGEPVETVRVVFAERWMAESEKRPLLDVGVQVYYLDENAELSAVVDEEPEGGGG